jgi:dihydroorotate dehydrogenase
LRYDSLFRPILFRLSPETAHEIGINALRILLSSKTAQRFAASRFDSEPLEPLTRFGIQFKNSLGIAAGFDKNAVVVNQLSALGFGFVEVGTVTFEPQKGNEKPRLFRLPADNALINRLGFNNDGAVAVADRLKALDRHCVVGVNIGRNKNVPNEDAVENYLASFELVHEVADYIAVNISSPNTPNLRELQQGENLEELLKALQQRNRDLSRAGSPALRPHSSPAHTEGGPPPEGGTPYAKPILVKIAPDLNENDIEMIVDVCLRFEIAGIIATNTTISRDGLSTPEIEKLGVGGLSGRPLAERSNEVIRSVHRSSKGKLPVIGVGGIFTAENAFEKIAAGASLLQAYTGFVYKGPGFARSVSEGLQHILKHRGFSTLDDAVGSEARGSSASL